MNINRIIDDGKWYGKMLFRDNVWMLKRVYGDDYREWARWMERIIKHAKYERLADEVDTWLKNVALDDAERIMMMRDVAHDIEFLWKMGIRDGVNEEFNRMGYRR